MHVTLWGVRGSIPVPGPDTVRYGGNTSCVEVCLTDGHRIILDAGTGLRPLGQHLLTHSGGYGSEADLFLTHTHWDHIQGFPFFAAAYVPGNTLRIRGHGFGAATLEEVFVGQMAPPYFPIPLQPNMKANLVFERIGPGSWQIGSAQVDAIHVFHPGYCMAYRIREAGRTLVYAPDSEPFISGVEYDRTAYEPEIFEAYEARAAAGLDPNGPLRAFVADADLLLHDATFTPSDYARHLGWGHASYEFPLDLSNAGAVKRLMLFHHNPIHRDEHMDQMLSDARVCARRMGFGGRVDVAIEGHSFDL